jgi:hypothetical protein
MCCNSSRKRQNKHVADQLKAETLKQENTATESEQPKPDPQPSQTEESK